MGVDGRGTQNNDVDDVINEGKRPTSKRERTIQSNTDRCSDNQAESMLP